MPTLLCIETASDVCSVALANEDELIGLKESVRRNSHAEVITVFIHELLQKHHLDKKQLSAVAVSKGPGSYTGLRIGISTAKGLCYALQIPLIAVNTLESMAFGMIDKAGKMPEQPTLLCPMIDARRMEVYTALFDQAGKQVVETKAEIIDQNSFNDVLAKNKILFFGNGSAKCRDLIKHPNAIFLDGIQPSAKNLISPALQRFDQKNFEDVAYFEPFYLKDFIAGIPRVKGLR